MTIMWAHKFDGGRPWLSLLYLFLIPGVSSTAQTRLEPESASVTEVRLRTVDKAGKRLANCPIYFVQTDAAALLPSRRPQPLLFHSNEQGKLFARLPVGHAWKVYAWFRGSDGPLSTRLLDLSSPGGVRELVLEPAPVSTLHLKGLARWREALPSGLRLLVDHEGVLLLHPVLPDAGTELVELPPMPRGDFSISLEHDRFGTVECVSLRFGVWEHPLLRRSPVEGSLAVTLGQPVKVEGTVLGTVGELLPGVSLRLLLPRARDAVSRMPVRSDAQGRFRLWFAWKRKEPWRPTTPKLLITVPGHLQKLQSLGDLCNWISMKTEETIDPDLLTGLDMASKRIIRLDRAYRLHWSVAGTRPKDQFFMKLPVPMENKKGVSTSTYLLPITLDDKKQLLLPGAHLIRDAQGKLHKKIRFQKHARGLDLYLLRDGSIQQLFHLARGEAIPQEKHLRLDGTWTAEVHIVAHGSPVLDARILLAQVGVWNPILSAPRMVSKAGSLRMELGAGSWWMLVLSNRRGQAWRKLEPGASKPEGLTIQLEPLQRIRILTEHPNPEAVDFPLRFSLRPSLSYKVPRPIRYMADCDAARQGPQTLFQLNEEMIVKVSPWARAVSARFRIPPHIRGPNRRQGGSGTLNLEDGSRHALEITWQ